MDGGRGTGDGTVRGGELLHRVPSDETRRALCLSVCLHGMSLARTSRAGKTSSPYHDAWQRAAAAFTNAARTSARFCVNAVSNAASDSGGNDTPTSPASFGTTPGITSWAAFTAPSPTDFKYAAMTPFSSRSNLLHNSLTWLLSTTLFLSNPLRNVATTLPFFLCNSASTSGRGRPALSALVARVAMNCLTMVDTIARGSAPAMAGDDDDVLLLDDVGDFVDPFSLDPQERNGSFELLLGVLADMTVASRLLHQPPTTGSHVATSGKFSHVCVVRLLRSLFPQPSPFCRTLSLRL